MKLRQIEAFKAVMETGTVTKAGARLNVSQPAVSKMLQLFERQTGLLLFTREKGRLSPTAEAHLLYDEVERVFEGSERVRAAAHEIRSLQRGALSIGVMPALSVGFVQDVLARLRTTLPGTSLNLFPRETPKLVEQLVTQQIELLYAGERMEHPEIRVEPLCEVPLVCIMPRSHRLAELEAIHCKDLVGEPFAAFRHGLLLRHRIDQAFEVEKFSPSIAMESALAPPICAFVARGLGVALVSPLYVGAFESALSVRPFLPRVLDPIHMATSRGRRLSMLAEAFAQTSREYAFELQAASNAAVS